LQSIGRLVDHVGMDYVCVTMDCTDPVAVATFWNEAMHWDGVTVTDNGAIATCGPVAGPYLECVRVPERKTSKNRVHLGCSMPDLAALDAEVARLEALGAQVAWEEEFPPEIAATYRNVVLRDVEGNEFCLGASAKP
jgi:hypothetical protein